jgi:hypothetical protein
MKRVFTLTALLIATVSFTSCSTNREKAASSGNNHTAIPSATPNTSNAVASSPTPSAIENAAKETPPPLAKEFNFDEFGPFNKNKVNANSVLKVGKRFTWKGIVKNSEEKKVLIFYKKDKHGNQSVLYAKLDIAILPARGTEIRFDGILVPGIVRFGGESLLVTTLELKDCHVR